MASAGPPHVTPSPSTASDTPPTSTGIAEKFEDSRLATLIDEVETCAEELFEHFDNQVSAVLEKVGCLEEQMTCLDEELASTRVEKFDGKSLAVENSSSVGHEVRDVFSDDEDEVSDAYSDDEYGVWDEDQEAKIRKREERFQAKLAQEAAREKEWQQKLAAQLKEVGDETEKKLQDNRLFYNNEREDWEKQIGVLTEHLSETAATVAQAEKERDHWKDVVEGYVEQRKEKDHEIKLLKQGLRELEEWNSVSQELYDELANDFDKMEKAMLEEVGKTETIDRRAKASIELWEKRAIEMRNERDDLGQIIHGYVEQRNEREYKIRLLIQQVEGFQTQKAELEDKVQGLEGRLSTSEQEREKLTLIKNSMTADSLEWRKQKEEAVQHTRELQEKIASLEECLAETERQNDLLVEESKCTADYICMLQRHMSDRELRCIKQLNEMDIKIHDRDSQIQSLAGLVQEMKYQKRDLENEVSEWKHRASFLEKEMADEDTVYMEEYARLESKLGEATKSAEESQGKAMMIQIEYGELAELVERKTKVRAEVEQFESHKARLEVEIYELNEKVADLQYDIQCTQY